MDGVKGFLQSRAVWASLVSMAGFALNKYGYEFTAADQASAVELISTVMTLGGSALAILYRIKATRKVATTPVVKA